MAELLTHVLAALAIGIILSWWLRWVTPPMIAAAMVGATLPDLNRLGIILPETVIRSTFEVTWGWTAFHRLGGTLLVVLIVALMVPRHYTIPVLAMLIVGATSHYALDILLWRPSGLTSPLFWPLSDYRIPIQGVYLSSDRWPTGLAILTAGIVLWIDRRVMGRAIDHDVDERTP